MNSKIYHYLRIIICIIFTVFLAACVQDSDANNTTEEISDEYYSMEDFTSIIIGESTAQDVYAIAPNTTTGQITSYGYIVEYPTENGKYIHIKLYGEDRIVGAIEEVSDPVEIVAKKYYSIEDFQSIVIGESTKRDVFKIAPSDALYPASYGAFCEYPMEDGRYIRIKFYETEMIVGAIEIVEWGTE